MNFLDDSTASTQGKTVSSLPGPSQENDDEGGEATAIEIPVAPNAAEREVMNCLKIWSDKQRQKPNDDLDHFGQYISTTHRKFDSITTSKAKMEIHQVCTDICVCVFS